MKKWLTWLMIATIAALILLGFWLTKTAEKEGQQTRSRQEELVGVERQQREQLYQFEEQLTRATTLEDFRLAEKLLEPLPSKERERFKPYLELSLACYYFDRAEESIFRAKSILAATSVDGQESNPIAEKYINESFRYYRESKKRIDSLEKLANDPEFNFNFFYARGNIYFRYLLLMAGDMELQDVFNHTVLAWREALVYREKDIDTEINLEILRKNKEQMMQNATKSGQQRLKMLPHQGVGLGKPRGIH